MKKLFGVSPVIYSCLALALISLGVIFIHYQNSQGVNNVSSVEIKVTDMKTLAPESSTVIFDQQFQGSSQNIYNTLRTKGVSVNPNMPRFCPIGRYEYYYYVITFFQGKNVVATATSNATGCANIDLHYVSGSSQTYTSHLSDYTSFWVFLNKLTSAPLPV